ncbi:MAG: trigger factor family protein, partial [Candidatus Margulisiibacteriota bacterium]
EGNKVFLEVEENYAAFEKQLDMVLAQASREIKLPGFRPGKAPKELVERSLDRAVLEHRAAQELVAEIYPQIINEAKIEPVDYPKVEILQQEKGKSFVFKVSVEVYPEVKLGKYKGLRVQKKSAEVTEEEIIKVLGNLQERFATIGPEGKKELFPLDDEFAKKV